MDGRKLSGHKPKPKVPPQARPLVVQLAKPTPPRLPDGSEYHAAYDASVQQWNGTLTVPGVKAFVTSASSVFGLMSKLDKAYRRSLLAAKE